MIGNHSLENQVDDKKWGLNITASSVHSEQQQIQQNHRQIKDENSSVSVTADEERDVQCILKLSSQISPLLKYMTDEEYDRLNESFAEVINRVASAEVPQAAAISATIFPSRTEGDKQQRGASTSTFETFSAEGYTSEQLVKEIDSLNRQILFLKERNGKEVSSLKDQVAKISKTCQVAKKECKEYREKLEAAERAVDERDRQLQRAELHLSAANDELKKMRTESKDRLRMQSEEKRAKLDKELKGSKYSTKQFMNINNMLEDLRLELSKEREER